MAAIMTVGCLFYLLVLLRDFLAKVVEGLNIGLQKRIWFLTFFTPAMILALAALWMFTSWASPSFVGVLGLVIMFLFIFLAMPIPLVFALVAFVFVGHLCGPSAGFEVAGAGLYGHVADYSWSVIALFILMAFFILGSELGADAYGSAYKWVGHVRGGLAIATVAGSTALAAVVGDPAASTITMGTVALPEMKKFKYADSLATGVVAAGATIGPMIPPSIGFIIYGILTGESIGKLFIAGFIPGLLLAASFTIVIYIGCLRNPELGPQGKRSSWGDRLKSLKFSGPIALLFIIIIGGIYLGIFSAIEGGGIGAFMAFVIALAMRRITWRKFKFSLVEAGKIISAIIFLIGAGLMFGVVLAASNLSMTLVELIGKLQVSPTVVVVVILFVYLILGCIMDAPIVLILTVPLITPIAKALGLDMIWLGVLLVLVTNLGMITPPYGMNVFMLKGIAKDVSITTIFRGVTPFVLCTMAVAVLILLFPQLATWLPRLLK
jgi:tripartite ATP-independent transporter DctM subunit